MSRNPPASGGRSKAKPSSRTNPKVLRVGVLRGPKELDPRLAPDLMDKLVLHQVFEAPYSQPAGEDPPLPTLFASPLRSESPDQTRFSAPLPGGIRFSDGSRLTTEQLTSWLRSSPTLTAQATIEVVDGRIVFQLEQPNGRFDLTLTQIFCCAALRKGESLLGTGPFLIADANSQRVLLRRNPHYRHQNALDAVEIWTLPPDADGRPRKLLEALGSGQIDLTLDLSREDLKALRGVNRWFEPGSSTAILYPNTERPPFSDLNARKALAYAIHREAIAAEAYSNPLAFTASGLLPPIMGRQSDGFRHDPHEAQHWLSSAGGLPESLRMIVIWGPRPYLPRPENTASIIAKQLATLGVRVKIEQLSSIADYYHETETGNYDLALSGWIPDTLDPAAFLAGNLFSGAIPRVGEPQLNRANLCRWSHPETDAVIEKMRREPSAEHQSEALNLLREHVPLIPVLFGGTSVSHRFNVRKLPLSPLGIPHFSNIQMTD